MNCASRGIEVEVCTKQLEDIQPIMPCPFHQMRGRVSIFLSPPLSGLEKGFPEALASGRHAFKAMQVAPSRGKNKNKNADVKWHVPSFQPFPSVYGVTTRNLASIFR